MKKIVIYIFTALLFISCEKNEDLGASLIDTSTPELSDLDVWIRENFTTPYNIEIKYNWDDSEVDNGKVLSPPRLEKVKPFLEAVLKIWINPYKEVAGEDFVKRFVPKQIVLIGSQNINAEGTTVLGEAEGGRKISIYNINGFSTKTKDDIRKQFHTMHHEFAHIMHQTIMYPAEFKEITSGGYSGTWFNTSADQALKSGFITPYASSSPSEDFVEIIATILTNSLDEYIDILAKTPDDDGDNSTLPKGYQLILKKQHYVVNYFSQIWKINIFELREIISFEMNKLTRK